VKRILLYAAVYGCIGAMAGVMVALYTQDAPLPKNIVLGNGSTTKASVRTSRTPDNSAEVVESPIPNTNPSRED
jgi:hypothetical protein